MVKRVLVAIFTSAFILSTYQTLICAELILSNTPALIYFSPRGGCTEAIVVEIETAKSEVLVQAYSFTSAPIAQALMSIFKKGVKVQVILDESQKTEQYTAATFLSNAGIPVHIDAKHAIAHNKVIIIDRDTLITGSFNFTKAAEEKNAENVLILRNRDLTQQYVENWERHREHSERYARTR
jgi:phosphatidylserine/phosphatidylglycerophosphate/cardiolipin synthase-like enzyme